MMMQSMCKKVVCFDLDDTLYKEIDYVQSAFNEIAAFVGHSELLSKMLQWYIVKLENQKRRTLIMN